MAAVIKPLAKMEAAAVAPLGEGEGEGGGGRAAGRDGGGGGQATREALKGRLSCWPKHKRW